MVSVTVLPVHLDRPVKNQTSGPDISFLFEILFAKCFIVY